MKQIITLIVFMVFSSASNAASSIVDANSEYTRKAAKNNIIFIMKSQELRPEVFAKMVSVDHKGTYELLDGGVMMRDHVCSIDPENIKNVIYDCVPYGVVADRMILRLLETDGNEKEFEGTSYGLYKAAYIKGYEYFKKRPEEAKNCSEGPGIFCYSLSIMSGK